MDFKPDIHEIIASKGLKGLPVSLKPEECAQILRVSRTLIYQVAATPGFPCVRVGKRIVVPRDSFLRWAVLDQEINSAA